MFDSGTPVAEPQTDRLEAGQSSGSMTTLSHRQDNTSPFDAIKRTREDGSEYWSARDLMPILGYGQKWQNFEATVERAANAIENQNMPLTSHVTNVGKKVQRPQGGSIMKNDFELSRFACYLVAMNGDPRKREIAMAQAYFAQQTRIAETAPAITAPKSYAEALRELASTIEAKEEAERQARLEAERSLMLEAQRAIDAPKVEYHDTFVADTDLIQFRTLANQLGIRETELRQSLRRHGWIYDMPVERWSNKHGRKVTVHRWRCKADKKQYFRLVPQHEAPRINGEVQQTLKITPHGASAIEKALTRWGVLAAPALDLEV